MKKIIEVFIIFVLSISMIACSNVQEEKGSVLDKDEIVIGMELAYPPFEMTDEEGNPCGISVDLAKAFGEYAGKKVRIENMAYAGLIPSLQTKKIDLIISSMTITEERLKSIDFSDPYCKSYLSILTYKDSSVQRFEDLNNEGIKIAVKKGTTGHIFSSENIPKAEIMVFDKESACILEVAQGKADAFIYDQMTIFKSWNIHKDTTRAILEPFQKNYEKWGIGMRKGDEQLKAKVNEFLKKYNEDGEFDTLADKYLKEQKETFEELGIPFFF